MPSSPKTVRFFCADMVSKVSYHTLKLYLAGVRYFLLEAGHPDPTKSNIVYNFCRGLKRYSGLKKRTRLPITIHLLRDLKHSLHVDSSRSLWDKRMLWCAFSIAFYGFLRSSEFVAPTISSFDAQIHLLLENVTVHDTFISIELKSSKTDPFRRGVQIKLAQTNTSTCPRKAFVNYLQLRKSLPSNEPLFCFDSGAYLTRNNLTSSLRAILQSSNHDPASYASHSFRIGAATSAAAAGIPDWLIQTLGRWSSDCFKSYIRCPTETLFDSLQQMSNVKERCLATWEPSIVCSE